ncbi:MAG: pyridoxal phosphate-dependent aminotransferase [Bacteroidia bacterium]|jgi:aspartate aminotransferase|nr:pyridoxal phosphate-dependent aminotransferase [Bacteroidales bacterium]MDD3300519.1 pyridoxal phosphate-dependent aminotransferase [Bacteroidales bacterium]MDD3843200.1 pyridoxal phosphate-dependent aminotransferase [Bacteroidales bacterium]MDD4618084.1 pyridoxal phosphate-dependent aminotransferase [Bacteroidales bacterium]NCC46438.1 pyridoxal phosphate-dependent aminotransferase [Bacteroidia bacterium]
MLTLSRKAEKMPASPIRKLVPYAEQAKKRGVKVYHLNIGQPDIDSPQVALDAIKNFKDTYIPYPHSAGIESYRKGLAKYYQGININVDENEINITTGGSESLQIALAVTCNPDDEVIVIEPFYTNYNSFAVQNDVVLKPITTKIEDGFALPTVDEFRKVITPKTKGIIICNPGNPTGTLYSKESLIELGKLAKEHNLFIYSDEVYREFCYTDEPHFSCMHLEGLEENVILLDSVSKRYSMCGVRIGAIVSKNKAVMGAVLRYAQARLCSPALGQVAAEGALKTPQSYFDAVRKEYMTRRDVMIEALNKMEGVTTPMPMGAFYTIAKLPVDDSDKFAQWLLEEFHYQNQTVMVAPAAGFYATPGKGRDEVRIAYVLKTEDLKNAMKCLEEALKQYPGRTI